MKRFFNKSKSQPSQEELEEAVDEVQKAEDDRPSTAQSGKVGSEQDVGQGDAERKGRRKLTKERRSTEIVVPETEKQLQPRTTQRRKFVEPVTDNVEQLDSNEDKTGTEAEFIKPPKPLPRRRSQGSPTLFSPSESESEVEEDEQENDIVQASSSKRMHEKQTAKSQIGAKSKKRKDKSVSGHQKESEGDTAVKYVNIKDVPNLPKVEPAKGHHHFASVCKYKEPISDLRLRARLLRYPNFTDQQLWSGDLAVVDDRTFEWQEKIFSKPEAKKYQKLENCITEQERNYHEELSQNKKCIGKYLHSYVTDDLYVAKKKMKLLTRKCPVPHPHKEKTFSRPGMDSSIRSLNDSTELDAAGDDINSDDSIEFDEPVSSSTPMQHRKTKDKDASEIAKAEKRVREKKEKELKELEKQNVKLKELRLKQQKEEEKRRQQQEAKVTEKMRKLEEIDSKEKELKAAFMKKYKLSKRPSVPIGARLRSVRLTPSPGKLERKKKSYTISRSSEISDFQDDELGSGPSLESKDDGTKAKDQEEVTSGSDKIVGIKSSKVGTEYGDYGVGKFSTTMIGGKTYKRFKDRTSFKNLQTMYIMASIPYVAGKCREVVVCMVQYIPDQQILVFKPALGYRNIETKRNNVFRISCEIYPSNATEIQTVRKGRKLNGYDAGGDANVHEDFAFFESVPKNEFRLCVFGEISTAHGFDSSPLCIYYAVEIPKGWRNDSLQSNTEGMTHTCYTDDGGFAHFSHEFSFQLVFSLDFLDEPNHSFPSPIIALMAVSMNYPSPRIVYEGYGYVNVPMTPGCHFVKIRMWKPRPRTIVEKMRSAFLDISPSLQDMKLAHATCPDNEENGKANLIGLQTDPSGTIRLRLHVIHQTPSMNKEYDNNNLDLLEKMSSATILRSVHAVIQAFQRARKKAENIKSQYD